MKILSLGAGVQSTALLLLSSQGKIPLYDGAIFSDTGWEPKKVYEHLDKIEEEIAKPAGIPIYRVERGNLRDEMLSEEKVNAGVVPLHIRKPNGKLGITPRQCTAKYKIRPIHRQVRLLLGAKVSPTGIIPRVGADKQLTLDIGISTDEFKRARDSRKKYIVHEFPLLTMNWSRQDCLNFLGENGWGETPKSSCVGCPFHSNAQWADLKKNSPEEWSDAVDFDRSLRKNQENIYAIRGIKGDVFIHQSGVPLEEAKLDKSYRKAFSCSPFSCKADEEEFLDQPLEFD